GDLFRNIREVTNTWYLSKMSSSKYDSDINFTYDSQGDIDDFEIEETRMDYVRTNKKTYSSPFFNLNTEPSYTSQIVNDEPNYNNHDNLNFYANPNRNYFFANLKTIKNPKYLSKITFSNGEVEFINQSSYRLDLPFNYALDKIVVKDNNYKYIEEFKLEYDYFFELPYVNNNESSRLKLKKFYSKSENQKKGEYIFEYNEYAKLPPQKSKKQDYWGYYNDNNSNSLIPN